jgi:hypothetical protein
MSDTIYLSSIVNRAQGTMGLEKYQTQYI